jgi:hypothetical protein
MDFGDRVDKKVAPNPEKSRMKQIGKAISRFAILPALMILCAAIAQADPGNGNGWGQGIGGGQIHKEAPELNPGSLISAVTVVACGFMILKARKRQK